MKVYKWISLITTGLTVILLGFILVDSFFYKELAGGGRGMDGVFGMSNSIWLVLLLSIFVLVQIICLFSVKPKLNFYRVGFYVLHIGLVLFLAGTFFYYIGGDKTTLQMPVDAAATYNQFPRLEQLEEGMSVSDVDTITFDFDIGISEMDVTYYDEEIDGTSGVKWYDGQLMIVDKGEREPQYIDWAVNHPVRHGGWKIYLMGLSYNNDGTPWVTLQMKKDPGELLSLAGIWMLLGGSVMMCLIKKRKAGDGK